MYTNSKLTIRTTYTAHPFHTMQSRAVISFLLLTLIAQTLATDGSVVQFVVYAEQQSDVTKVFPGAHVDHTWNNLFIVSIWTNTPDTLIPEIRAQLETNAGTLKTIISPFTLTVATQKWIEYNLVWVAMLLLIFLAGCACGGIAIAKCNSIKQEVLSPNRRCRTTC
jgi:hypothetical protein